MGAPRRVPDPRVSDQDAAVKYRGVPEAGAEFFSVGARRAYQLAEAGDLPTVRIGGRLRVPVGADGGLIREVTR